MDQLTVIFMIGSVFGIGMIIYMHTKPGKKWLKEL